MRGRRQPLANAPRGRAAPRVSPPGGFASVADALRIGQALGAYLNSPAAADLDGSGRAEALEQLGAITSLLGAAAYEAWRAREPDPDDDPAGRGLGDRSLTLDTTLDGAGRLRGGLTPECSAALAAVIDALGKNHGPQDLRTARQRSHDALQEACELLIRAKMVPGRAGSDTRVDVPSRCGTCWAWTGRRRSRTRGSAPVPASTATYRGRTPRPSRATR